MSQLVQQLKTIVESLESDGRYECTFADKEE